VALTTGPQGCEPMTSQVHDREDAVRKAAEATRKTAGAARKAAEAAR